MKILFLARLFEPHQGGVEKHVLYLSRELLKRGYDVTLITEQFDSSLPLGEQIEGINVIRIPYSSLQSKLGVWSWMVRNWKLFQRMDIVHAHDVYWWYLPIRILLPERSSYITFHGYEGSEIPRLGAVWHRRLVEGFANGCICIGDFMRKWYKATPEKVSYGAAGVEVSARAPGGTAAFVGRFDDDTSVLEYVQAARKLQSLKKVDMYGDGSLRGELLKVIFNEPKVAVREWNEDIESIWEEHDIAFVSRYLGVLEAMQAKRLVCALYNNEIKKDYLQCHPMKDNMIIAQNGQELYTYLINLTEEQKRRMIESSYEWARKQTWQKLAQEYVELWKNT